MGASFSTDTSKDYVVYTLQFDNFASSKKFWEIYKYTKCTLKSLGFTLETVEKKPVIKYKAVNNPNHIEIFEAKVSDIREMLDKFTKDQDALIKKYK